jgi:hypothetical protein
MAPPDFAMPTSALRGHPLLRAALTIGLIVAAPVATGAVCGLSPISRDASRVSDAQRTIDELALLPSRYEPTRQVSSDDIWPATRDLVGE